MSFEIDKTYSSGTSNFQFLKSIPILEATDLSYNDFFRDFILQNKPCIIKGVTDKWESCRSWVQNNKPNFDFLKAQYGDQQVTIYNCLEKYYNSQKSYETKFEKYLNYFESKTSTNVSKLDYLKNWHLQLLSKNNFYEVPIFFASDWLNEYYISSGTDDYRFVYMGPKYTWTPFHADVFNSYSWSANILGKKRWLLLPPGGETPLRDRFGNLPYDLNDTLLKQPYYDVVQETGEVIFVPSGWHHQVWNLEDTISINHNWINGCNIEAMYSLLLSSLLEVRKEIEDCIDMCDFEEHCQIMLNASFGINFFGFFDFLTYIALTRIDMLKNNKPRNMFHNYEIGHNHILFDLLAVKNVLKKLVDREEVNNLEYFKTVKIRPLQLLREVGNVLESF